MDTKYFQQALAAYCKAHRLDSTMPMSARLLSELLQEAQRLKQADLDAQDTPPVVRPS